MQASFSARGLAQAEIEMYPIYNSPSHENPPYQDYVTMPMKRQEFVVDGGNPPAPSPGALLGLGLVGLVSYVTELQTHWLENIDEEKMAISILMLKLVRGLSNDWIDIDKSYFIDYYQY